MNLFKLVKNTVEVAPHTLTIKEFKDVYSSDSSKKKEQAVKELAYVYYMMDWNSVYNSFIDEERHEALKEDLELGETWVPSHLVKQAMKKYDELQETPTMKYAKSIKKAFWDMIEYFKSVNYKERDSRGLPVYKLQDVTKAMADSGKLVDSINKFESLIKKEQTERRIRGDAEKGLFEDPDNTLD